MEQTLIPYQAQTHLPARSVLALAPHPDDEVFGCGGALARHALDGVPLRVVVLSDGAFGQPAERYLQHVLQREAESRAAAAALGTPEPQFWRLPDRGVVYDEALVLRITEAAQQCDADLIYAPALSEMHPDHRSIAMAAIEAVRRIGTGVRLAQYEVGVPLAAPNLMLDITPLLERKQQAMACFGSQQAVQDYLGHIAGLNRFRSYTLGPQVKAAEAFAVHDAEALAADPLGLFRPEFVRQAALGLPVFTRPDTPLVSVLVRWDGRADVGRTLDALSLQTYPALEVLVLTDADADLRGLRGLGSRCGRFALQVLPPVPGETVPPTPEHLLRSVQLALEQAQGAWWCLLAAGDAPLAADVSAQMASHPAWGSDGLVRLRPRGTPARADDVHRFTPTSALQAAQTERDAAFSERDTARALLAQAQAEVAALHRSTSWRVTAPLRTLRRWWRGAAGSE